MPTTFTKDFHTNYIGLDDSDFSTITIVNSIMIVSSKSAYKYIFITLIIDGSGTLRSMK